MRVAQPRMSFLLSVQNHCLVIVLPVLNSLEKRLYVALP